jgi:hypothetical protein
MQSEERELALGLGEGTEEFDESSDDKEDLNGVLDSGSKEFIDSNEDEEDSNRVLAKFGRLQIGQIHEHDEFTNNS